MSLFVFDQRGEQWEVIHRVYSSDEDCNGYILLRVGDLGELAWVGLDGEGINHTNRHAQDVVVPASDLAKYEVK